MDDEECSESEDSLYPSAQPSEEVCSPTRPIQESTQVSTIPSKITSNCCDSRPQLSRTNSKSRNRNQSRKVESECNCPIPRDPCDPCDTGSSSTVADILVWDIAFCIGIAKDFIAYLISVCLSLITESNIDSCRGSGTRQGQTQRNSRASRCRESEEREYCPTPSDCSSTPEVAKRVFEKGVQAHLNAEMDRLVNSRDSMQGNSTKPYSRPQKPSNSTNTNKTKANTKYSPIEKEPYQDRQVVQSYQTDVDNNLINPASLICNNPQVQLAQGTRRLEAAPANSSKLQRFTNLAAPMPSPPAIINQTLQGQSRQPQLRFTDNGHSGGLKFKRPMPPKEESNPIGLKNRQNQEHRQPSGTDIVKIEKASFQNTNNQEVQVSGNGSKSTSNNKSRATEGRIIVSGNLTGKELRLQSDLLDNTTMKTKTTRVTESPNDRQSSSSRETNSAYANEYNDDRPTERDRDRSSRRSDKKKKKGDQERFVPESDDNDNMNTTIEDIDETDRYDIVNSSTREAHRRHTTLQNVDDSSSVQKSSRRIDDTDQGHESHRNRHRTSNSKSRDGSLLRDRPTNTPEVIEPILDPNNSTRQSSRHRTGRVDPMSIPDRQGFSIPPLAHPQFYVPFNGLNPEYQQYPYPMSMPMPMPLTHAVSIPRGNHTVSSYSSAQPRPTYFSHPLHSQFQPPDDNFMSMGMNQPVYIMQIPTNNTQGIQNTQNHHQSPNIHLIHNDIPPSISIPYHGQGPLQYPLGSINHWNQVIGGSGISGNSTENNSPGGGSSGYESDDERSEEEDPRTRPKSTRRSSRSARTQNREERNGRETFGRRNPTELVNIPSNSQTDVSTSSDRSRESPDIRQR